MPLKEEIVANKVGFVGLGIMGLPMAGNLLKAGYELKVYDVVQAAVEQAVARHRRANPAADHAAEPVAVYDLQRAKLGTQNRGQTTISSGNRGLSPIFPDFAGN